MQHELFEIEANGHKATLTTYVQAEYDEIAPGRKRPFVVICPGGAYARTSQREAEPVALALLARGFNAAILRYSCEPTGARWPTALLQLMKTVALVREMAVEWNADPARIEVMGFSAGGHLTASLGVFWNEPALQKLAGIKANACRPDRLCLCYPVITNQAAHHAGSFENLLGEELHNEELRLKMSLETGVGPHTPPCFIWHTVEDEAVPVESSLLFATALRKEAIPFEMHLFQKGGHGLSLATEESGGPERADKGIQPECQPWIDLAARWLKDPI